MCTTSSKFNVKLYFYTYSLSTEKVSLKVCTEKRLRFNSNKVFRKSATATLTYGPL